MSEEVEATFEFEARKPTELNLRRGDVIVLTSKVSPLFSKTKIEKKQKKKQKNLCRGKHRKSNGGKADRRAAKASQGSSLPIT